MVGVYWPAFRGEERKAAQLLDHNLSALNSHTMMLRDALELANYCEQTRAPYRDLSLAPIEDFDLRRQVGAHAINTQFIRWKAIALRDGAVIVHNFAECKKAIGGLLPLCPSLKGKLDRAAMREAERIWKQAFPDHLEVRTGVAHSGRLFNRPGKREQHTIPGTQILLGSMYSGTTMTTSIGGKMSSYSLTEQSAAALEAVRDAIYRAYAAISEYAANLPTIHHDETPQPPAGQAGGD